MAVTYTTPGDMIRLYRSMSAERDRIGDELKKRFGFNDAQLAILLKQPSPRPLRTFAEATRAALHAQRARNRRGM
jgi:hypothetical protein